MAIQTDLPGFAYNIVAPKPAAPVYINPPAPRVPYVNPGGNITLGEFAGGGARPNMYGVYDPAGAANVRAALPAQAAYTPGQYGSSMGMRPMPTAALGAGDSMPLAVRPNAAPATTSSAAPAMKAADVLNVRTVPGTGGASAAPMLEAGGAGRAAGVGSRLAGMGSMVGKALPFVGDALQGAAYGYEGGSVGRGVAAALGSLGGRVAGAAGGSLVAPGVGTAVGSVGGSVAGAAGAAKLYDYVAGSAAEPVNEAAEFQKRMDMRTGDSPELRERRTTGNLSGLGQQTARAIDAQRDTRANYPSFFEPSADRLSPVVMKKQMPEVPSAPAKPQGFQAPSAEEAARFRRETGTAFDPKSINDKLNMDRMRAGEGTFDSKQARAYRAANPNYRPGQYSSGGSMAGSPQAPSAPTAQSPSAPATQAPAAPTPNMTLEQRGLARTVSSVDPATGEVTRNTSPRPTPAQMGAATRADYYQRYRNSRS